MKIKVIGSKEKRKYIAEGQPQKNGRTLVYRCKLKGKGALKIVKINKTMTPIVALSTAWNDSYCQLAAADITAPPLETADIYWCQEEIKILPRIWEQAQSESSCDGLDNLKR